MAETRPAVSGATIARPVCMTGRDHLGRRPARVELAPAGPGTGICFNGDLRACIGNASVSGHVTCLGQGPRRAAMVEHLLAACYGLGVTDLAVRTSRGLPLGDGSASPYARLLWKGGVVRYQEGPVPARLRRPLLVTHGRRFIAAIPSRRLTVTCLTDFAELGPSLCAVSVTAGSFLRALARARTFAHTRLSPAVLAKRYALRFRLKRVGRLVCPQRPRFRDEACRHKVLDLLGDLALLGRPLAAELFTFMPGHKLNLALVRRIDRELEDG